MTVASPQCAYISCVCMTCTEFTYMDVRTQTDLRRRHREFSKMQPREGAFCKPPWTLTHLGGKHLCLISILNQISNYYVSIYMSKLRICIVNTFLWSSGQSSWLQTQRTRVRFPALSDFLRCSGSGTGFNQPREDK
jgi:hypothetical protein